MTTDLLEPGRWPMRIVRFLITVAIVAAAIWAGLQLWDHYELSPWTRDGRVRANVVQIAPDVSGLVTAVPIEDNQEVRAGTLLFEVDRARYTLALRQAEAALAAQRVGLAQSRRESARNAGLGTLVSAEIQEQTRAKVEQAQAAVDQAVVALDSAKLNLERAQVRAPIDGLITNLDMRTGSYAAAGRSALALVDSRSIYVEGYFEETKLARIHIGDRVHVTPMGGTVLQGTVQSIVAGIADRDRSTSANLLPSVNPTFNWVRLAQRIPVRVKLDPLPAGTRLVAGQTVTVQVVEDVKLASNAPGQLSPEQVSAAQTTATPTTDARATATPTTATRPASAVAASMPAPVAVPVPVPVLVPTPVTPATPATKPAANPPKV